MSEETYSGDISPDPDLYIQYIGETGRSRDDMPGIRLERYIPS